MFCLHSGYSYTYREAKPIPLLSGDWASEVDNRFERGVAMNGKDSRQTRIIVMIPAMILLFLFAFSNQAEAAVPSPERQALIAVYNATGGEGWSNNSGWKIPPLAADGFALPGTECDWYGVDCSGDHVTGLNLFSNMLAGDLPAEIGNLSFLWSLNLGWNQLTGIPTEIGNLTGLDSLDLEDNLLTEVPAEIGNLTALTHLYLENNQLASLPAEIGNLTTLRTLWLHNNRLTSIPAEIGNLTTLELLWLHNNQLAGIPAEIGNLTALTYLSLFGNQLTSIPAEIGNLTALTYLNLSDNQLASIPAEIFNLTALHYLYMGYNQIVGIPAEIGNLTALTTLAMENNQLTSIPSEIGNLTALTTLFLDHNQLTNLPEEITNTAISNFGLDVGYNALEIGEGPLQDWLNDNDPDWESLQTTSPSNIAIDHVSPSSITLSWTPIAFQDCAGGYEIFFSDTSGGAYEYFDITADKTVGQMEVTGLTPGTSYYFVIRTVSECDPGIYSVYSREVFASTLFLKGDVDNSKSVDLADAILCLQITAGITPPVPLFVDAEINGDQKLGIQDAVGILQYIGRFR